MTPGIVPAIATYGRAAWVMPPGAVRRNPFSRGEGKAAWGGRQGRGGEKRERPPHICGGPERISNLFPSKGFVQREEAAALFALQQDQRIPVLGIQDNQAAAQAVGREIQLPVFPQDGHMGDPGVGCV